MVQQVLQDDNIANEAKLQGYFYQRTADFLKAHDKVTICWGEIKDKGITTKTTIMAWQNIARAKMAVKVVMTPLSH